MTGWIGKNGKGGARRRCGNKRRKGDLSMGTYPSAALQIRPTEQPDLLGNFLKIQQLRNMQQQGQLGQQQIQQGAIQTQQMQSDLDSQKAFTRAYQETQGDPQATVQKALQYGAKPQFVDGWLKSRAELDKITEEGHEKHLKNLSDGYGLIGQQAQAILTLPPDQRGPAIQQAIGSMVQGKGIEPGYAQQLLQSVPQDPAGQETWLKYHALPAISAKDQVDARLNERRTAAEEMSAQTGANRLNAEMPGGPLEPGRVTPAMRYQQGQENARAQLAASKSGDGRDDRSYQFSTKQLDESGKPIADRMERLGRLQDTINQVSPQADALIAPELLTVMAGGQGSGLRMNEAEISRIVGGRTNWESLKAAANKWQLDPSKGLSVTPTQRQQIRSLVGVVYGKLQNKQAIIDAGHEALINAQSVDEQRRIVVDTKKKLSAIDAGSGVQVTDPRGVVHTFPDQASADKFKKLAGLQ
jgi:hypothetical protein